jgi:tetratricopeptide (TPR) repeat protein
VRPALSRESGYDDRDTPCPPAEALARYIDGRTDAGEAAQIESHVALCDDCFSVFAETNRQQQSGGKLIAFGGFGWRPQPVALVGLAAAAAIFLAVIFPRQDQTPDLVLSIQKLQTAVGPYREFESRLAGDTTYRQLASVTRSGGEPVGAPVTGSAAELETAKRAAALDVQNAARASRDHDAATRALASMYFSLGDAGRAVETLEPLAASTDAGVLNDLAAAYLARRADGDAQKALGILDRVVAREPQRAEAWFNLGLAAEAEGQSARAIEAWREALKLDSTSGWANESRFRLQKLTTR